MTKKNKRDEKNKLPNTPGELSGEAQNDPSDDGRVNSDDPNDDRAGSDDDNDGRAHS